MSSLKSFRQAIQTELAADLSITMKAGKMDGPAAERDIGCCWSESSEEMSGQIDDEQLVVRVRVFKRFKPREAPEALTSPDALEDLADAIKASIRDKQTALGPWFARVTGCEIDMDAQYVEAIVIGVQANSAV